jgi:hypothetical protein
MTKQTETSKIIVKLVNACPDKLKASKYLAIKHKGARRSLCLQLIRKHYYKIIDQEIIKGLNNNILANEKTIKVNDNGRVYYI